MGGPQAYKGFGLGLMVEIFAVVLSGGPTIREVPITQNGNCVFMQVIDPEHCGGVVRILPLKSHSWSALCDRVRRLKALTRFNCLAIPSVRR